MKLSFEERAQRLGHSLEILRSGMPVTSLITVNDVDQLKEVLTMFIDKESNPNLGQQLFQGIPVTDPVTDHTALGTLRRVNEFIYNDAELVDADRARIKNAFPMSIQATSATDYEPTEPVSINSPTIPQAYNYGTVTLNQGIYINIYNTVITSFTMDSLVRNGTNGNPNIGDINIFGATGTMGVGGGTGASGTAGSEGSGGTCTVSGSEPGDNGGPGGTGGAGSTGGAGNPGGPGQPSYQATFNVTGSVVLGTGANPVLFFTRSGTGGSGGPGGTGGNGGAGGKGGDGASCECTGTSGGKGGNGGDGGSGGRGGDAGNAVSASANIIVNIPTASKANVQSNGATAQPGSYGQGGAPGSGGAGGGSSSGGKGHSGGSSGTAGSTGAQGNPGNASQVTGNPAIITINTV